MMIAPPAALVSLFEPWAGFYGDSQLTQTLVTFAHVGGLVVGGGIAIASDRMTLRLSSDVERRRHLLEVAQLHRTVIVALITIILSGFLLFAADVEAYWASWIYWVKMVLVALLLANGARMRRIEATTATELLVTAAHWRVFRGTAVASLTLWLAVTLAGVALLNYA